MVRRVLRELKKASDWNERISWDPKRGPLPCEWHDETGVASRAGDLPSEVRSGGMCIWHQNGKPHRESQPAQIDVWGDCRWAWEGSFASRGLGALLTDIWRDKKLTDIQARQYLAMAKRLDASAERMDLEVSPIEWAAIVVARHRSPRLSDEMRTEAALMGASSRFQY